MKDYSLYNWTSDEFYGNVVFCLDGLIGGIQYHALGNIKNFLLSTEKWIREMCCPCAMTNLVTWVGLG